MKYLLLLLLSSTASAAPLVQPSDIVHTSSCSVTNWTASASPANAAPFGFGIGYSTVTITLGASNKVRVWYSGQIDNNTSARFVGAGFIVDGGFDSGISYQHPLSAAGGSFNNQNGFFSWITTTLAAGVHNFSFTMMSNGIGTVTACASVPAEDTILAPACQFCVEEVK